jgi:response regulator NasT
MMRALRIAVADDEQDMRDYFQDTLPVLGHEVVAVAKTGRELVERCHATLPDLIVTDVKMPDMDGIEAVEELTRTRPVPVILVSAYHDAELIERAEREYILAYLVKPIKQADLETAIAISMRRSEQFHALSQQAADLRQALEDRKIIERAKGILMKRTGLDEQQAFRRLQRVASEKNCKLVEIAKSIVIAEDVTGAKNDK